MKKLTKKEKAMFPEFIVRIDLNARGNEEFSDAKGYHRGYYIKAMEEKDILSAMKRVEKTIYNFGWAIYLVDILGKTDREAEDGRPLYEAKIRCRVHLSDWEDEDGNRKALAPQWHFLDAEHSESDEYEYEWYAWEDRYGHLEYLEKGVA